jgi:DNA-binding SARP family transcriptional activator
VASLAPACTLPRRWRPCVAPRLDGRVSIARRIAAAVAASALLVFLSLAWQIHPGFPANLSAPFDHEQITRLLSLLAWAAFVLLDIALLLNVVRTMTRRRPTGADLRLKRALESRHGPVGPRTPPDWRAFAHTLEPPVFQVTTVHEPVALPLGTQSNPAKRAPELVRTRRHDESEAMVAQDRVRVHVLGPLQITGGERDKPQRKAAAELIAYLTVQPQGATRDELLEALWPNDDPRRSEQRFWQASAEARKILNGGVRRDHDRYLLDRDSVIVDLDELETLFTQAARADSIDEERRALESALALFRGEPFAGIEAPWAESEARRLRALAVDILERVGRLRLDAGEATGALDAAERGIALDLLNEGLWRLALEAEGALGLREAIAERYEALRQILDERLGLEPNRETRTLHRQLLSQT